MTPAQKRAIAVAAAGNAMRAAQAVFMADAAIQRARCIGFEQGCGCATCQAIDRQHKATIERARAGK